MNIAKTISVIVALAYLIGGYLYFHILERMLVILICLLPMMMGIWFGEECAETLGISGKATNVLGKFFNAVGWFGLLAPVPVLISQQFPNLRLLIFGFFIGMALLIIFLFRPQKKPPIEEVLYTTDVLSKSNIPYNRIIEEFDVESSGPGSCYEEIIWKYSVVVLILLCLVYCGLRFSPSFKIMLGKLTGISVKVVLK
jgi:hypothetical protein